MNYKEIATDAIGRCLSMAMDYDSNSATTYLDLGYIEEDITEHDKTEIMKQVIKHKYVIQVDSDAANCFYDLSIVFETKYLKNKYLTDKRIMKGWNN